VHCDVVTRDGLNIILHTHASWKCDGLQSALAETIDPCLASPDYTLRVLGACLIDWISAPMDPGTPRRLAGQL
jgi:hypothetical protein